ncbi:GIY-YIG nuclease family protein [Burkholderia thailandensis]|uniref:GIY-YIG nuclease family protein n=1 Tax=Burkholderia thailandensis TaxID=57975 RepID=UPI00217D8CE0|nr:GIY-YIG nuclease family protein [Burkholderia thailandensis]MCS6520799.1 GIY-YIG nuclease family protein [Burkholderia thailandensis]
MVKIGYTTQELPTRKGQLYTTGAMFKFEELESYTVENYDLLEQALHKLLAAFRLNNAREFFAEDALPFVKEVVEIHRRIRAGPGACSSA